LDRAAELDRQRAKPGKRGDSDCIYALSAIGKDALFCPLLSYTLK